MTQYNRLNVKLSNSQLNKLKSSIKNETDVVLRILLLKLLLITHQLTLNYQKLNYQK